MASDHDILLCLADVEQVITDRLGVILRVPSCQRVNWYHHDILVCQGSTLCVCDEKTWASDWVNIWRTCLFDPFQSKEQQGCEHNFLIHCLCLSFSHACCLCVSLKQVRPTELPLWSLSRGWFGCVGRNATRHPLHAGVQFTSILQKQKWGNEVDTIWWHMKGPFYVFITCQSFVHQLDI